VKPRFQISDLRPYNEVLVFLGSLFLLGATLAVLVTNQVAWWAIVLFVLGFIVLGGFLAANLREVKDAGKQHGVQVRANLSLMAVAVLIIVIAVNYIIQRHPLQYDMTSNKVHTLSPQTLEALKALKSDVTATMFVTQKKQPVPEVGRARELLRQYAKHSTKFHFETIDADVEPAKVKQYGVHEYNTVMFEGNGNRKDVLQRDYVTYAFQGRKPTPKFQGEQAFTNALIRMGDTAPLTVYFTEGHGERELASPQNVGLNVFKQMLEGGNYVVKSHKFFPENKVPSDCSILAAIGPTKPFTPAEASVIATWLRKGGKLILCLDPLTSVGLEEVFTDFGVKLGRNVVIDKTSFAPPDLVAVVPQYINHAITDKLAESRIVSVIPYSRSVQKVDPRLKDVSASLLLLTTDQGGGETDLKSREPKLGPEDMKGPVHMAYAFEWTPPAAEGASNTRTVKSRLVVFGSSPFLTNALGTAPGNMDLGVNAFNWAAMQESKISIRPKQDEQQVLNLTNVGAAFVKYLVLLILPLAILGFGGYLWYRRRSL